MHDLTANYIKWISDFTKEQFDTIVEVYIKKVWKIEELVVTDGTNDGGNDVRIFSDNNKLKVQLQVTVQESAIDGKINKELINAVENVKKHGYEKKLYFFYSYPVSEDKINDFESKAEIEYGIELRVIDAKKIASATKFSPELIDTIHAQYGLKPEPKVLNENDKVLYDFVSFGNSTQEIKSQIVKAYLTHKLFEKDKMESTELVNECCSHFKSTEIQYFKKLILNLKDEKILEESKNGQKFYSLSLAESNRINLLKSQFAFQEQKLDKDIKEQLQKFDISESCSVDVIQKLRELFESNFNIDKQEILDKAFTLTESEKIDAFRLFYHFVRRLSTGSSQDKIRLLVKNLLLICKDNDILQRLSAAKLFSSFSNPDVVRNYISQTGRLIFCDTRIAMFALCIYYDEIDHTNKEYEAVKDFLRLRSKYSGFEYKIYYRYIDEVAYQIKDALLLIPFEDSNLFSDLGGSSNLFFNYYLYLKDKDLLEEGVESFADFMFECFELKEEDSYKKNFISLANAIIEERLNNQGITVFEHDLSQDFFSDTKQIIHECQLAKDKFRPEVTVKNDAKMLSILFDPATSINEPVFITWDQTLFAARKKFHHAFPSARLWHYFTPNQFVNHISLLNFNIDSQTITREILSTFDETFNLYKKAHHLLDTVSRIVNVRTETGRKYVQKIKEFRKEEIYGINRSTQVSPSTSDEQTQPVEKLLLKVSGHYAFGKQKFSYEDFKQLFTVGEVFDKVISFFRVQIESYKTQFDLTTDAFEDMDKLIEEAIQIKKNDSDSTTEDSIK